MKRRRQRVNLTSRRKLVEVSSTFRGDEIGVIGSAGATIEPKHSGPNGVFLVCSFLGLALKTTFMLRKRVLTALLWKYVETFRLVKLFLLLQLFAFIAFRK